MHRRREPLEGGSHGAISAVRPKKISLGKKKNRNRAQQKGGVISDVRERPAARGSDGNEAPGSDKKKKGREGK